LVGRQSRSGGQWVITASPGSIIRMAVFAGVALTTIDVAYLAILPEIRHRPERCCSLLSSDGIVPREVATMKRLNRPRHVEISIVLETSRSAAASAYYFKSPLDGMQRLILQVSEHYPLVILATEAQDDVLAYWRREAAIRLAFVFGLTILIAIIGFYLVRQLNERQRMAAALSAKERTSGCWQNSRGDMVMRVGLDERILYVSPHACGLSVGIPASSGNFRPRRVNAEDLRVQQAMAA